MVRTAFNGRVFATIVAVSINAAFGSTGVVAQKEVISGPGARSCAEFAADYREDVSIEVRYFFWAQGYMSAINATAKENNQIAKNLAGMTRNTQLAFIRVFCDQNPLKPYWFAAIDLYSRLPVSAGR